MAEVYASVKQELIESAIKRDRIILPTARRTDIQECFTVIGDHIYLWYNTVDGSTHIASRPLPN